MPPTEDPAALVEHVRQWHHTKHGYVDDQGRPICPLCGTTAPCERRRLADALEAAQKNNERLELQLFNCIGGPHTGHEYTNGITGEVTYCCPAHQDGYTWLKDARADAAEQRARVGELEAENQRFRALEWDAQTTPPQCPWCMGFQPTGHHDGCSMVAALAPPASSFHVTPTTSNGPMDEPPINAVGFVVRLHSTPSEPRRE